MRPDATADQVAEAAGEIRAALHQIQYVGDDWNAGVRYSVETHLGNALQALGLQARDQKKVTGQTQSDIFFKAAERGKAVADELSRALTELGKALGAFGQSS